MNGGTRTTPRTSSEMVTTLHERASLATTMANPDITLARAAGTYILFKRRRLTATSERGYSAVLEEFTAHHPNALLSDFEPPAGSNHVEDFLEARWGDLAERTYNKSHAILSDFFKWHVARGTLHRDPMGTIERAKTRAIQRVTFTKAQVAAIFAANSNPRDEIALRLLLHYAIRKGALRGVRFDHFDHDKRRLTVFTKGEKFHTLPIVEDRIWKLLGELREPGHHYLLPRQTTRKRTPPTRTALGRLAAALQDARLALVDAVADPQCARELADLSDTLELTNVQHGLAVISASVQVRLWPSEPIGEHGTHLWWYRCLTRAGVVEPGTTRGRRMHTARHTAIQAVLEKTGNLKAAQAVAGHANVGTTGDIYTGWEIHQTEATLREVIGS